MMIRKTWAACALLALLPIAPAQAAVYCDLSDGLDSFSVVEWVNADGKGTVTMTVSAREVVEAGPDGRDYLMAGVFVVDPSTGRTLATAMISEMGASAAVHVEVAGQRTVRALPQRDLYAGTRVTRRIHPGTLPAGTYHLVGVSTGGGAGISADGAEDRTETETEISATGLNDCTPLEVDGSLHHIDEHDFTGTQVSVPGAGIRDGARATLDVSDDLLVGAMQHDGLPRSELFIDTPSGGGKVAHTLAPLSSFAGRYTFTVNQTGTSARVNVNALAYSVDGSDPDPDPNPY